MASVVAIVESGDLRHLCDLGSGTCKHTLDGVDPTTVPTTAPTILETLVFEPQTLPDGASQVGGRLVELCGRDGLGKLYFSEILVFRGDRQLLGKDPVYWIGLRIARGNVTETPRPQPTTCPPALARLTP